MADNFGQTILDVVPFQGITSGATWVDINNKARINGQTDLLTDIDAINNSIKNLFTCHIGARGPTFRPDFGTFLSRLLQEPLDNITAQKIRISSIQSLQKWEPRIQIITQETQITAIPDYASYFVRIAYIYLLVDQKLATEFILPIGTL